jgi:hypothetical protein
MTDHRPYAPDLADTWVQPPLPLDGTGRAWPPQPPPAPTLADVPGASVHDLVLAVYLAVLDATTLGKRTEATVVAVRMELDEVADILRVLMYAMFGAAAAILIVAVALIGWQYR